MVKSEAWVKVIRESYPKGTRIMVDSMEDAHAVPAGMLGAVTVVDDIGTIHVNWDNGQSLGLISGVDFFHRVGA